MPVNLVRDADITALSLVKRGANRRRFFLLKSQPPSDAQVVQLPACGRIVKAAGWSTAYIVVAEPGAHENPGSAPGTDQSIEDRWASEEEIRKAAHRWMHNGGLVNKMHEDLAPYGQVVENFIAPEDFAVDGETIRKGSWVVGIQPTAEGKQAIASGEFTGVSIEGVAVRELVEKGATADGVNAPTGDDVGMDDGVRMLAEAIKKRLAPQRPAAPATTPDEDAIAERIVKRLALSPESEAIRKAFEFEGVDPALAGALCPTRVERAEADQMLEEIVKALSGDKGPLGEQIDDLEKAVAMLKGEPTEAEDVRKSYEAAESTRRSPASSNGDAALA